MSESPTSIGETSPRGIAARIGWTILIVVTLFVCYFSHLGAVGFVGPDEPRYAWIARDMAETGDWVTPRLYGKPWFEKPPLYYWGAAICFKIFGVSETAARLPSAICALLATLALAWLAWRLYGAETARWLLLLLPTTVGMIGFSHAAATDMPFSGMLTIAMVFAAVVLRLVSTEETVTTSAPANPSTPWFGLVLFGFFLGLAVLAKGPAAIVLSGGAVFFWAIFTKRWRDAFRLFHPAAIAAFCLTALPWYFLCARRNPDFFRIFIIEHNFRRFLTPEFQHIQPFWFYGPIVIVAVLPWLVLLFWTVTTSAIRLVREKSAPPAVVYLTTWSIFCLLFFSTSQSKLPGYILPSIPPIVLLMARSLSSLSSALRWKFRLLQLFGALLFLALSFTLEALAHVSRHGSEQVAGAAGILVGLIGTANLILSLFAPAQSQHRLRGLASGLSILPVLIALFLTNRLVPSFFFWEPSGKAIAQQLQHGGIPADKIFVQGMRRGQMYGLSFYLRKEVEAWNHEQPVEGYLLMGSKLCAHAVPSTWTCQEQPFDTRLTGEFLYRVGPTN